MNRFIDTHRDAHGVEPICKVLPIAPSTYYRHAARLADPDRRSARAKRDETLCAEIRRIWNGNFRVYGARKVWRALRRDGEQALYARRPAAAGGLVHHSDRGSQYLSIRYTERLAEAGVRPSVGSVGDSYDNALAETVNGLYKA